MSDENPYSVDGTELQLVVFRLGGDFFALPITRVNQIIPLQKITPVPRAPSFVEGVTDLTTAGRVIPVIDLRTRFGLTPKDEGRARIIVSEHNDKLIGMTVDGVDEVLTTSWGNVEPPDEMVVSVDSQFIAGIVRIETQAGSRLIILLDQEQVLSPTERRQLQSLKLPAPEAAPALPAAS